MDPITALLYESDPVIAVVGATDNLNKYGAIIYRDLKAKGYRVLPVNPTRDTVDGDIAYPDLGSLPETPDIVNIVVPPQRTLRVLDKAEELGIENIWIQPGAEDQAVMDRLQSGPFQYLANACIMVRARAKTAS
jgi:predicted CoA-binding protein